MTAATSQTAWIGLLVMARLTPVVFLLPMFGKFAPAWVRIGFAMTLAGLLAPMLARDGLPNPLPDDPVAFGIGAAREIGIGAALGLLAALPLYAAQAAGRLVDRIGPRAHAARVAHSPTGEFYLLLAVVIWFAIDGHLMTIRALAASFVHIPIAPGDVADTWPALAERVIAAVARLFESAIGLAAPALAAGFLADLTLGLVGRASRELAVPAGASLRAVVVVFAVALALPTMAAVLAAELIEFTETLP